MKLFESVIAKCFCAKFILGSNKINYPYFSDDDTFLIIYWSNILVLALSFLLEPMLVAPISQNFMKNEPRCIKKTILQDSVRTWKRCTYIQMYQSAMKFIRNVSKSIKPVWIVNECNKNRSLRITFGPAMVL